MWGTKIGYECIRQCSVVVEVSTCEGEVTSSNPTNRLACEFYVNDDTTMTRLDDLGLVVGWWGPLSY